MPLLTAGPSRFLGGGNVTWLLRDEFTTDLAAGAVNGTAAEPGPGTRTVISDVANKISIAGGANTWAASGVGPVCLDSLARVAGRMAFFSTSNGSINGVGITDAAGAKKIAWRPGTIQGASYAVDIGTASDYPQRVALCLRATGNHILIKISGNWFLVWVDHSAGHSPNPFRPAIISWFGSANAFTVDYIRVPDSLWLPTPLISDGFATTFATSDGLGHAEGIATGIGAGGGGVAWTQQVGTWAVGSAKANAATLSGGIAVATVSLTTANVVMGAACVRSAGEVGVVLSWADSSNYVRALHNGTNVQLIKTVAGTPTTLVNAAATYSAGARLVVTKDSTAYRVYYNNSLVGTEQTIADAGIISNTLHGLFSTDAGNTLDDFVVYARGNEGQYAALDRYSGS